MKVTPSVSRTSNRSSLVPLTGRSKIAANGSVTWTRAEFTNGDAIPLAPEMTALRSAPGLNFGTAVFFGLIFNTSFYMSSSIGILNAVAILWLYVIVLLSASGLLLRTLGHLNGVDLGFAPDRVLTAEVAPRTNATVEGMLQHRDRAVDNREANN